MRLHVLVAAALVVACLGVLAGDWIIPPASAQATPTKDVLVKDTAFQPPVVEIVVGTKVIWTNEDSGPGGLHTATEDGDDPAFDETLFPKEFAASALNRGEYTFEELGVVKYHCEVHSNMKGEVRVVEKLTALIVKVEAKDDGNNRRFDPSVAEIDASQTVNFTNAGSQPHNVAFEDPGLKGGDLPPGRSIEVGFGAPGVYRFRCTLHSASFTSGMIGEIRVAPAANGSLPPGVQILSPTSGQHVAGTVSVSGTVTQGPGRANATAVEVRIGANGEWEETMFASTEGTWRFAWDTTTAPDGPRTLYARAPSEEIPEPTPVSLDVVVQNAANGTSAGPPTTGGATKDAGDVPGLGVVLIVFALVCVALLRRRP